MGFLDTISNAVSNMFGGGDSGGGGNIATSAFNTLIQAATGGFKGRPQWRDLSYMNDAQNRLWPDEIKRQGQFLEGIAPSQGRAMETMAHSQGAAHNTFQDATYAQDTQRSADRIKTLGTELGMSPWEITGTGSQNTPVPGPQQGSTNQGQNPIGGFLQGIIPLQIAKMQNQTQLRTAEMANATQRYGIDMAQGKGDAAKAQIAQTQAQTLLTESQAVLTGAQTTAARSTTFINSLRLLLDALPTFNTGVPGANISGKTGTHSILQALKAVPGTGYQDNDQALAKAISELPDDRWKQLQGEIAALAKGIGETAKQGTDQVTGFLGNLLK